ncbi:MAG: hypothetical protein U5K28_02195 [Halobacteriales archaeon]|nr:hypothetical protein [Halobacteriales archaeon]
MSDGDQDKSRELFTGVEDAEGDLSSESLIHPVDRPRGILSPTDREYLCGMKDYSHNQTELNRRQAIRERTIEGIRDFNLLWLLLGQTEWEKVMEAFDTEELNTAFSSILAFMFIGIDQDTGRMRQILRARSLPSVPTTTHLVDGQEERTPSTWTSTSNTSPTSISSMREYRTVRGAN